MARTNQEVASAFAELADLLEMTGGERFRVLAYRRAAETIESTARDVSDLSQSELRSLSGIGKATAEKIREFAETGKIGVLEDLRALVPAGVREMTRLGGLGPKKAMLIHSELGVSTLDELRAAIDEQRLRDVKGLGPKTEENLLRALSQYTASEERMLLGKALTIAERMVGRLEELPGVRRVAYAGSLRRMRETIGDIDLLATAEDPRKIMDAFTKLPGVARVVAKGATKSTVTVAEGLQVDLRVVALDEYGAALQYFTGSKQHNVNVREHAIKKGLKLSEYGLFSVEDGKRLASETEEEIYAALGMQTPAPTMREDRGEVELALRDELPDPVEISDIRGELHGHSNYSDGRKTILEMAGEAARRGYRYWAITDHGRRLRMKSLELEDIDRQAEEVRRVNQALKGKIKVLHGVELNIGPGGELDYPDEVLARFEVRVASVHGPPWDFESMTRRLSAAVEHPLVNILGHPTGRRMGRRPAAEFDLGEVFKAAAANFVALEVNCNPQRLDLKDDHVWAAREYGCAFAINTDAHKPADFDYLRLGVGTAQRGWATSGEVINAWPLTQLRRFLEKR